MEQGGSVLWIDVVVLRKRVLTYKQYMPSGSGGSRVILQRSSKEQEYLQQVQRKLRQWPLHRRYTVSPLVLAFLLSQAVEKEIEERTEACASGIWDNCSQKGQDAEVNAFM